MSMPFRRWVQCILALLLAIEIAFTVIVTAHSARNNRRQALTTYESSIRLYSEMLSDALHSVEINLSNLTYTQTSTIYAAEANDGSMETMLARHSLSRMLGQNAQLSSTVDGAFFLHEGGGLVLNQYAVYQLEELDELRTRLQNGLEPGVWNAAPLKNRWCLIRAVPFSESLLGVYVDIERLLATLHDSDLVAVDDYCVVDRAGAPLTNRLANEPVEASTRVPSVAFSARGVEYLPVSSPVGSTGYALIALINEKALNGSLYKNYFYSAGFAVGLCLLTFAIYVAVKRHAIRPFSLLAETMTRFKRGDLEARVEGGSHVDEINATMEAYNAMAGEVNQLKIANYESELARSRTELQFFQLQIQPHFLINTLNTIYTLSQAHADDLIQRLTMFLVEYYRYTIKATGNFVRLRDELDHVRSYLGIHEIRLGEQLDVFYDVDESMLDVAIPPIVLQTFVENSVQYAVSMDEVTFIGIEIQRDREDADRLRITITDTGKGFPEECLSNAPIRKEGKLHIGIHNVRERLRIAYAGEASLTLSNTHPHGARADIVIPIIPYQEETERV